MTDPAQPTTNRTIATEVRLPAELRGQVSHLAEISYPFEACGVLLGRLAQDRPAQHKTVDVEQVLHARNINVQRPRDRYLLDPDDFLAADRAARDAGLEIVGIWHSHPDASPRPSRADLKTAWEGYSYLIAGVTALGPNRLRSWRLEDGRFREETLVE